MPICYSELKNLEGNIKGPIRSQQIGDPVIWIRYLTHLLASDDMALIRTSTTETLTVQSSIRMKPVNGNPPMKIEMEVSAATPIIQSALPVDLQASLQQLAHVQCT